MGTLAVALWLTHLSCMDLFANNHLQCEKPKEREKPKNTAQMRHSCALSGLKQPEKLVRSPSDHNRYKRHN